MKKKVSILFITIMMFLVNTVPFESVFANEGRDISKSVSSEITFVLNEGDILSHNNDKGVLEVNWKIDQLEFVNPGDYFVIEYDNSISQIRGNKLDSKYASCTVDHKNGIITCKMNQEVKNTKDISGEMKITQSINLNSIPKNDGGLNLNYNLGNNKEIIKLPTKNETEGTDLTPTPPLRKFSYDPIDSSSIRDNEIYYFDWNLWINEATTPDDEKVTGNIFVEDELGMGHLLRKNDEGNFFEIIKYDQNSSGQEIQLVEGIDYTILSLDDRSYSIEIFDVNKTETIGVKYQSTIKENVGISEFPNEAKLTTSGGKKYEVIETAKYTIESESRGQAVSGEFKVLKLARGTSNPVPNVKFEIYSVHTNEKVATIETDENGEATFSDFDFNKHGYYYKYKEVSAPDFITFDPQKEYTFDISNNKGAFNEVWNDYEKVTINVSKKWINHGNDASQPEEIKAELLRDGQRYKVIKLNQDNAWFEVIDGLDFMNPTTKLPYKYEIKEIDLPSGYKSTIEGEIEGIQSNINIINELETVQINGEKYWQDENSPNRPKSIEVLLLANDEVKNSISVSKTTDWQYSFSNLPKYDDQGNEIKYTVSESPVEGYESKVNGNNITNTRVGKTSVSGSKKWLDDNSPSRPNSIIVELLANGEKVSEQKVTAEDDWKYSFDNLDAFDKQGKEIEYTIDEVAVKGYESKVTGFDITNVRVGKTSVSGTKIWLDDNSTDRPDSITINLYANGEKVTDKVVTAENEWHYTFENLAEFDSNGKKIDYTIEEVTVDGYETSYDNFNIINLRVGTTSVSGSKKWLDDNSSDRPESITINLYANGEKVTEQKVTAEDGWKYSFDNLAEFDKQGKEIEYSVDEVAVKGYESKVTGLDITNLRVGTTSVSGTKTWLDDNADDRPDSIKVNLLANGEVLDTTSVSEKTDWNYSFDKLAEFDSSGKKIDYTIEEVSVDGYETSYDKFNIINLRVGTISISGTKTWLDDNADDRPDSITVELYANGEKVTQQEVTVQDNWEFTFDNLAQYDNQGKEIEYTIQEIDVKGYQVDIKGFDITNTRSELTEMTVNKVWEDDNNSERPDKITVTLNKNGEVFKVVDIYEENNWTYTFELLEKFDEKGKLIDYTVEEDSVEGYTSSVVQEDDIVTITNALIPTEPEEPTIPEEPTVPVEPVTPEPEEPEVEEVLGVSRDPKKEEKPVALPEVEEVLAANRPPVLPQTGMGFGSSFKLGLALLLGGLVLVFKKED